jgi:hypothetical protein
MFGGCRRAIGVMLVAVTICATVSAVARAEQVPTDPDAFASYVARAFANALSGAKVSVTAPLYLSIDVGRDVESRDRSETYIFRWKSAGFEEFKD